MRQTILPEVGVEGAARLAAARVLLVGAGGLGSAALPYLVGAGVGRVTLIDPDVVALENLHRQVIYRIDDVGTPKVLAAARRMRDLDPSVPIDAHALRLDAANAAAWIAAADVVIDATDDAATKLLLSDACVRERRPLVWGSVTAFEGLVSVFGIPDGPCLRCLHPRLSEGAPGCSVLGVLGPVVGMVGALQATEALKVLLASRALTPLVGRLWLLDARDLTTRVIALPRRDGCLGCASRAGEPPRSTVRAVPQAAAAAASLAPSSPAGFVPDALYVDVREAHERRTGAIPGSLHRPLARFLAGDVTLPEARRIVLYCAHGQRSLIALRLLERAGVRHATHMEGGLAGYDGVLERFK